MQAIRCVRCGAFASPSTMLWCEVARSVDHDVQHGPVCRECHGPGGKSMQDADAPGIAPSDDDLEAWIDREGGELPEFVTACERAIERMISAGEIPMHETMVPYGSTNVSLGVEFDWEDVPVSALRSVAYEWWEEGKLGWSRELTDELADGHRHAWLVQTSDEEASS